MAWEHINWLAERTRQVERASAYRQLVVALILSAVSDGDAGFLCGQRCAELCRLCKLGWFDGRALLRRALRLGVWKQSREKVRRMLKRGDIMTQEGEWLGIKVVGRSRLPHWLLQSVRQSVASNPKTCLPIVILQNPGDDLVVLRLADFEDWFGEIREFKIEHD